MGMVCKALFPEQDLQVTLCCPVNRGDFCHRSIDFDDCPAGTRALTVEPAGAQVRQNINAKSTALTDVTVKNT